MKTDKELRQAALNKMVDKHFSQRRGNVYWADKAKNIEFRTEATCEIEAIMAFKSLVSAETVYVEGGLQDQLVVGFEGVTFPWER